MLMQLGNRGTEAAAQAITAAAGFLPTTLAEARQRGWDELDVVMVTGDAYVDHPAFGPVRIARFLARCGLRVGLLAQPDWRRVDDFRRLGRPRLFFGVSAGNLDSMLYRLTAQKPSCSEDPYSPGGRPGGRPDRATLVYSNRCREAFPEVPIILGGIEASLRRIAHYDYWSDTVRRPILVDAKADLLVFGPGEQPIWEVAQRLQAGESMGRIRDVRGTAFALGKAEADALCADLSPHPPQVLQLPGYEEVCGKEPESLQRYARMARRFHFETNPRTARPLLQRVELRAVYFNPPALPEPSAELAELPFMLAPHPSYAEPIPALKTARHALAEPAYLAGHPGSTLKDVVELALYLKRHQLRPQNVQDFIPLPMSLAATMYHTGLDPLSTDASRAVHVTKGRREKKLHKALLLYWDRAHHELAREALHKAGRADLIGHGAQCLVPPESRLVALAAQPASRAAGGCAALPERSGQADAVAT